MYIDINIFGITRRFPDLYYTIKYRLTNGVDIDIVVIDTVVLCGNSLDGEFYTNLQYLFSSSEKPSGPRNKTAAHDQWRWIEQQLKESKANYLLVAGHYPLYSTADHGPTQCLIDKLKPLLQKYNVTAYLSGHDHNLQTHDVQHLKIDNHGSKVHQIISGAGAFTTKSERNAKNVPSGSDIFSYPTAKWYNKIFNLGKLGFSTKGGFVTARMTRYAAEFSFYKGNLDVLHSFSLKSCIDASCHLDKDVLKFLVLGDWGGQSAKPYYTKVQKRVADILGQVATEENTDFQISVGDNFYPKGVKREADPRFK
uniref:Calcineurin-like phosphoesterase domain-containing protein n=1 Tax=Romanomermis culicivorax TaxID=13658 RepID=A0A915KKX6_ROMCU